MPQNFVMEDPRERRFNAVVVWRSPIGLNWGQAFFDNTGGDSGGAVHNYGKTRLTLV